MAGKPLPFRRWLGMEWFIHHFGVGRCNDMADVWHLAKRREQP